MYCCSASSHGTARPAGICLSTQVGKRAQFLEEQARGGSISASQSAPSAQAAT